MEPFINKHTYIQHSANYSTITIITIIIIIIVVVVVVIIIIIIKAKYKQTTQRSPFISYQRAVGSSFR